MWRPIAVAVAVVVIAVLTVWLIRWLAKQDERREDKRAGRAVNGDLNARQEKALLAENNDVAAIVRRLLTPPSSVDGEIILLPDQLHTDLERWLHRHDTRKAT